MKPTKRFELQWVFSRFEEHSSFILKRMFGGLAAYLHGRMVMVLMESNGDREWKGKKYPYEIWNGILVPTEREFHESLTKDFSSLVNHPVLPKWLYLPAERDNFEDIAEALAKRVAANDPRFGIIPKPKKKKVSRRKK